MCPNLILCDLRVLLLTRTTRIHDRKEEKNPKNAEMGVNASSFSESVFFTHNWSAWLTSCTGTPYAQIPMLDMKILGSRPAIQNP